MPVLTACAVPIHEIAPPTLVPEQFSQSGEIPLHRHWWLAFNDPELNHLVTQALTHNFSLLATFNRLQQAEAIAQKASANLIPSINALFKGQQQYSDATDKSQFTLGLNASYEVDLWGRIRAQKQAAELDIKVAQENIKTAAISLSAEVAITWYRLIEQNSQLALLEQQIKTNKNHASITLSRFAAAQSSAADLFQQRQILEERKGDRNIVLANIKVLEYQLAILTGHTPGLFQLTKQTQLPELPAKPITGLGIDLIQRRPDLRLAYFRVQAADQRTASAIADRFPKLSLAASIDTLSPNLQSLFNNWIATLAGNLILPIIDGGRRVAEVNRTKAIAAEALNQYATAVQEAIKDVESSLIQEQQQQQLINSLDKQFHLSQQATQQIRLRYLYGSTNFLRVLTAQISQQILQRRQITAKRRLLEYRIQLYRALAGGWNLDLLTNVDQT